MMHSRVVLFPCYVSKFSFKNYYHLVAAWRSGSVVGLDQRGYLTLSPVSTGMGDRVRVRLPEAALYFGM